MKRIPQEPGESKHHGVPREEFVESLRQGTRDELEKFLTSAKARGVTESTIGVYRATLSKFLREFNYRPPRSAEPIREYLARPMSGLTRRATHRLISAFYAFLFEAKEIVDNPMLGIKAPKVKRVEADFLEFDEAARLIKAAEGDFETALIVHLYLGTGLRLSEGAAIKVEDVGPAYLKIIGKEADQVKPILPETRALLVKVAGDRQPSEYIFPSPKYRDEHISPSQVQDLTKALFKRAGIEGKQASPHTLRHSFVTLMQESGCNSLYAHRLVRHADGRNDMTAHYSHTSKATLLACLEQYSPLRTIARSNGAVGNTTYFTHIASRNSYNSQPDGDKAETLRLLLTRIAESGDLAKTFLNMPPEEIHKLLEQAEEGVSNG